MSNRMTCELARDELSAQLDGEQSPTRRDRSPWMLNAILADRTERRPAFRGGNAHVGFVSFSVSVSVVCRQAQVHQ